MKRPEHSLASSKKTFAEFFAGIGLVHLGLRPGGWQCIYANDIEPKKRVMYESEFGPAPYYHVEDIWQTDRVMDHFTARPFLATASFPCIDLSLAGHWRGFEGLHSSTYFGFIQALNRLRDSRPKMVMLENVYGFISSRGGKDFQRAVLALADLGYWIDAIVLDAKWFVPQSRPRLFVFGFHDSLRSTCVIRQETGFGLTDPWVSAVESSALVRPNGVLAALKSIELPTGWATVQFNMPAQMDYRLLDMIDLGEDQDWWSPETTLKHYAMMEAPSRRRVDELVENKATAAGAAFRRTRRGKMRCEVRFDVAGCLRTPKGGVRNR